MNRSLFELIARNKSMRTVLTVAATLLLGALGSGLWELFLKDVFLGIGNRTLTLISSLWSGYLDSLYRNVGRLHSDLLLIPIFSFFAAAGIVGPLYLTFDLWQRVTSLEKRQATGDRAAVRDQETLSDCITRARRKVIRLLSPLTLSASSMFLVMTWQTLYAREASNWSERSIEIVSPHIPLEDRVRLRSDLRAINNAKSFFSLRRVLLAHANRAAIELPKFDPIGTPSGD